METKRKKKKGAHRLILKCEKEICTCNNHAFMLIQQVAVRSQPSSSLAFDSVPFVFILVIEW
jgi:hypothetical protein